MTERIERLVNEAIARDIQPQPVAVTYDDFDEKLAEPMRIGKRLAEYMDAQPVVIGPDNDLVGLLVFDGSVESDIFPRTGHRKWWEAGARYYTKPQDNLCLMEWQHSNANFARLIRVGFNGLRREIEASRKRWLGHRERLEYLAGMEMAIRGIERRAYNCACECRRQAAACGDPVRKARLLQMAANCMQVPMNPARTFEEAVQCLYFSFDFLADSIGRPDQYLWPFYQADLANGTLTRDRARELLQELWVRIHGYTRHSSGNYDKGGESHFAVGGYTIDRECAWNDLSRLIVESMMECDLYRPQVSLRWNLKTPREVLRFMMDCERNDKNKRIAFANDEPRIAAMLKINKLPWEVAYDYIMVGCNEPAFQGGISLGGCDGNVLRSIVNTLNDRRADVLACRSWDDFYAIYEEELFRDLETMVDWSNRFNMLRSRDCNVLSSLLLDGCIERAESATRGGASLARTCISLMGGTNTIDSLCIIRQFIFEEQRCTMRQLVEALDADWQGHESLRAEILRDGRFYGNNDDFSNQMARKFHTSLYNFAADRTDIWGFPLSFGNLTGYNPHFASFGALTQATPDGRVAGAALLFGSGQSDGKDHDGITSHLLAVAHMDPTGIMCGNTIMNLSVDEPTVRNDASFEKLVTLIETYFREGGLHVQLNHVAKEDLIAAKQNPHAYKSLRVRVSGFSAYFTGLREQIQDNVIARTVEKVK